MKIRTSFVANSSSSSFICIASLEEHNKALAVVNEAYREAIDKFAAKTNVFGKDVVKIKDYEHNSDDSEFCCFIECDFPDLYTDNAEQEFAKYCDYMKKQNGKTPNVLVF
jgi:hypothetical protein